jgi:hypothetical protein
MQHVLDLELLLPQYPRIDAVVSIVGVNDFHTRLMYGTSPAYVPIDLRVPAEREALIGKSFFIDHAPGWTRAFVLGRLVWNALNRHSKPPLKETDVFQDSHANVFARLRQSRKNAQTLVDLPDVKQALTYYRIYLNQMIDAAIQCKVRLVLATQPSMWRPDLPQAARDMLWMGGIGDVYAKQASTYHSVEALAQGMSLYNDVLREVTSQRRIEMIDLANLVSKDPDSFYDDVHFNEPGAKKVARIFADYFMSKPLQPPQMKSVAQVQPHEFSTGVTLTPVEAWGPQSTKTGASFKTQPNGDSALWIKISGQVCDDCFVKERAYDHGACHGSDPTHRHGQSG